MENGNEKKFGEIITFGKYRGQPIESLEQDPEYTNWLLNQDWFKKRHPSFYQIIINNFAAPQDTPEHNRLQVIFLDEKIRLRLFEFIGKRFVISGKYDVERIGSPRFEVGSCDVIFDVDIRANDACRRCQGQLFYEHGDRWDRIVACVACWPVRNDAINPTQAAEHKYLDRIKVRIEIKPAVGDDYPSIMRQMHRSNANVLFLEQYTGSGISRDDFVAMFESQKMWVVFAGDMKSTETTISEL